LIGTPLTIATVPAGSSPSAEAVGLKRDVSSSKNKIGTR
jgi:hypothetical protein